MQRELNRRSARAQANAERTSDIGRELALEFVGLRSKAKPAGAEDICRRSDRFLGYARAKEGNAQAMPASPRMLSTLRSSVSSVVTKR